MDSSGTLPDGRAGFPSSEDDLFKRDLTLTIRSATSTRRRRRRRSGKALTMRNLNPLPPLCTPPESLSDVEITKKSILAWARKHGYAIRTQPSKTQKNSDIL